jgi:hypothetical protein
MRIREPLHQAECHLYRLRKAAIRRCSADIAEGHAWRTGADLPYLRLLPATRLPFRNSYFFVTPSYSTVV